MIIHIYFFVFLFLTSTLFSLIEIQAEGQNGWAAKFPTWRIDNKWTQRFFYNGRPLTGYHLYFLLFMITVVHIPYGLGFVQMSLSHELRILSFLILFFIIEDFMWFVLNPGFGLKKFKAENIWWWAPSWWVIMPREYWIYIPVGTIFYVISWLI